MKFKSFLQKFNSKKEFNHNNLAKKKHVIISGTGRSGTTFLVQLLTALGLDTGFDSPKSNLRPICNAGMERDILSPNAPYIIKNTFLCDRIEKIITSHEIQIEHAIVPVRKLFDAAESRRRVSKIGEVKLNKSLIPGGLWKTKDPNKQEEVLAEQFYKLVSDLVRYEIPTTFLFFPRTVEDPQYLYDKLSFLLKDISYKQFYKVFKQISQPNLVHDFSSND